MMFMVEVSKRDWKLYRERLADWQERYMERLCREYVELLTSDTPASDRFWKLEKRIRNDKKDPGVIVEIQKSNMLFDIVRLMKDGAISSSDLSDFSEELQEQVKFLVQRL